MEPSVTRRAAAGTIGVVLSVYLLLLLARADNGKTVLFEWESVSPRFMHMIIIPSALKFIEAMLKSSNFRAFCVVRFLRRGCTHRCGLDCIFSPASFGPFANVMSIAMLLRGLCVCACCVCVCVCVSTRARMCACMFQSICTN